MKKEIIEKLDLIIDDRYKYSNATILYNIQTYTIKGLNISISEFDHVNNKDLRSDNCILVFYRYKTAYKYGIWTSEAFLQLSKEIVLKMFKEELDGLKDFYYMK